MKPGLQPGKTPHRVFELLGDGKRRTLKEICAEVSPDQPIAIYNGAAQALLDFHIKGQVKREHYAGKYRYWRETASEAS